MKISGFKLALAAAALAVAGGVVVVSGIIPLRASSGHWPITQWFLHFSMQRSIATHSLGIEVPPLDEPGLILKGAGHYETGCRSCHGSPGTRPPQIARQMLPFPPDLSKRVAEYEPRKLFYVVKHGMKFTGMPAWPAPHRDDEVWAVVAFLLRLPELDKDGYRNLVHGEPAPTAPIHTMAPPAPAPDVPAAIIQTCARCHGSDGLGRGTTVFPRLARQRRDYLHQALEAYATGTRHSGIMGPIAAGLTPDAAAEIAAYYSELPVPPASVTAHDQAAVARGKAIAENGIPEQRVPSCIDCHGSEGKRHKSDYPALAGQPADYLVLQLELFQAEARGGSEYAHLMRPVASRLEPRQMRDVAEYFAAQAPQQQQPQQTR